MPGLLISYRRDDAEAYAGRIYDQLVLAFGKDAVFMDIDAIPVGEDFISVIESALAKVQAVVVVIGPDWLGQQDSAGQRRLDDPDDFVRLEVLTALDRDIHVIPVLFRGAPMPAPEAFPSALQRLSRRNALEVGDARFHVDMEKLGVALAEIMIVASPVAGRASSSLAKPWFALAATVALLLIGTAMWRHFDPTEPHVSATQ
jgi:hypothetical protein